LRVLALWATPVTAGVIADANVSAIIAFIFMSTQYPEQNAPLFLKRGMNKYRSMVKSFFKDLTEEQKDIVLDHYLSLISSASPHKAGG
jgi:hypothetical protein